MVIREEGAVSTDPVHQRLYGKVPYGFLYAYNPQNFLSHGTPPYPDSFNSKLHYQMVGKDDDFAVGSDIANFDFRNELKNLKMPVLIYGGMYNRVAVPSMMIKFKEYYPHAQFVIFEKSGIIHK